MENGNHKWQDVVDVEMDQIKEYGVFKDYGKAEWEGKTHQCSPLTPKDSSSFCLCSQTLWKI